jgi:hypothetical protein
MWRPLLIVPAALALLALAACGPTAAVPSPSATPPAPPSATASSTPSPAPAALVIPDCGRLLSLEDARALFSDNTEFFGQFPGVEFSGHLESPEIGAAISGATQSTTCRWGVPNSDGSFSLLVAETTSVDRANLTAALTAAGFASSTAGSTTSFTLERDGVVSTESAVHVFTGDVWILSDGTGLALSTAVAASALDALRAANPTLGL